MDYQMAVDDASFGFIPVHLVYGIDLEHKESR